MAPAVLAEQIAGDVPAQSFGIRSAMLEFPCPAPEAATVELNRCAGLAVAALGVDRDRAAQRVEPEQRIRSRHQRELRNRDLGDEVPGNDIAEGLVLPDAVHIDRDPFRRSQQRRSRVAPIAHVGLVWILLILIDVDRTEALIQQIGKIERAAPLQIERAGGLDRRRNLVYRQVSSGERSRRDDIDSGSLRREHHRHRA